jgi:hypothetical protein
MNIQPIVEGHGEVEAFPVLLRRLRDTAGAFTIDVGRPIRRKRSELVQEQPLRTAIRLALLKPACGAIVVLFDGDNDCPAQLAPQVQAWAQQEAGTVPCAVVMAHREYEAWFLAAHDPHQPQAEAVRDAKGAFDTLVGGYLPTVDQPSYSATFDMQRAHSRSRSFRRMVKVFGGLATALGAELQSWPPAGWAALEG